MAKDIIHEAVKNALIKDGWIITDDPFRIQFEEFDLSADLAAERSVAAEKGKRRIVVEIKSFVGRSFVRDLQQAMGQYEMYLKFMKLLTIERELFLAVNEVAYQQHFGKKAVRALLQEMPLPMVVVDVEREEITQWKK